MKIGIRGRATSPQILAAGVIYGIHGPNTRIVPFDHDDAEVRIGGEGYEILKHYGSNGGKRRYDVEEKLFPFYKLDPQDYGVLGRVWADFGSFFVEPIAKDIVPVSLAVQFDLNFAVHIDLMERRDRTIPFCRAETMEKGLNKQFPDQVCNWNGLCDRIRYAAEKFLPLHVKLAAHQLRGNRELQEARMKMLVA